MSAVWFTPLHYTFDSAFQDKESGEMFVPASDGSGKLLPTGFAFELVTQSQPHVQNMEGPRFPGKIVSPWAFATQPTAENVLKRLKPFVPGAVLYLEAADTNTQFPYSHDQLQIVALRGDREARINAGLLASNIARTTALLDGEVRQFPWSPLSAAAGELLRELEHVDE
jgi:hypothetical protein